MGNYWCPPLSIIRTCVNDTPVVTPTHYLRLCLADWFRDHPGGGSSLTTTLYIQPRSVTPCQFVRVAVSLCNFKIGIHCKHFDTMSSNETRNPEAAPTTDALVATGNTASTSAAADLQNIQKDPSADGDMSIEATTSRMSSMNRSSRNRTERPQQQQQVDEDASQLLHSQVQLQQKQIQQQQRHLEVKSQQMARIELLLLQQHHQQRQQQPSTFKEPDTGMLQQQHQQQRQQSATHTLDTGSRQADLTTFPGHPLPTLSDVRHATRDTWLPAAAAAITGYQTVTQTQQRTKGRHHIDIDWLNEYVQLTPPLRS